MSQQPPQQPPDDRRPAWEGGTYFPPPRTPNQPSFNPQFPQQGNYPPQQGQFPQQRQPFNPQYPSGQYPPLPQQGYPPQGQIPPQFPQQQQYQQQPPMMQPTPQPPKKKRGKGLLITAIVLAVLMFGCIGTALASHSGATTTPATSSVATIPSSSTKPTTAPIQPTAVKQIAKSDVKQVGAILNASIMHYQQLLVQGKSVLGTYQYASSADGIAAFNDPNSYASRFSTWRKSSHAEQDLSFIDAFKKADAYYNADNEPNEINNWQSDMSNVQSDLAQWVQDAVAWQIQTVSTDTLNADEQTINKDIAAAQNDVTAIQK
ncbi:MAG: hypothetical protein NVS4B7_20930 [Ktedonobacteraceae bacterium]